MINLQDIYDKSPYPIQSLLFNLYAYKIHWRYGNAFKVKLDELTNMEKLSRSDLESYQLEQLQNVISDAYQNVPHYQSKMKSLKLTPKDFNRLEDLQKLPILTKAEVKADPTSFLNARFQRNELITGATSGTTGNPLKLYYDKNAFLSNNVFDWRQKRWAGIEYGDRLAFILGRPIVSLKRTGQPFWQKDHFHNHLWLSAFHMARENLDAYVNEIQRFGAKALEGYPSTIYVLAKYLEGIGATLPLKAVFVSSEPLHEFQRELIEKCFECKVFNFYGMAERVVFATECERHNGMHLNYEYGVSELTSPVQKEKSSSLILTSTGLINSAMPLIRYQTNDVGEFNDDVCECGRCSIRIPAVETKREDMIVRPDGTPISSSVLTHPFKTVEGIQASQIVQTAINHVDVFVVEDEAASVRFDQKLLLDALQPRIGSEVTLTVNVVEEIPRDLSGKFRWVVNRIDKH